LLAALWFVLTAAPATADDRRDEIAVRVGLRGEIVDVSAELTISASRQEVWDVLTDFENLPRFVSNIASSRILSRQGNTVRVLQTGRTALGPLTFDFQSEREIVLSPVDGFESRMIRGNLSRYRGTTRLETSGDRTRVVYRAEAVPDTFLPISLGMSLIESETREHYAEIRREVMRRKR
jgi:carbon monoxide dehydrogenase subunit G